MKINFHKQFNPSGKTFTASEVRDRKTSGRCRLLESVMDTTKTCKNCAHCRCLFHGENRLPLYRGLPHQNGQHCWIDPDSDFGKELIQNYKDIRSLCHTNLQRNRRHDYPEH